MHALPKNATAQPDPTSSPVKYNYNSHVRAFGSLPNWNVPPVAFVHYRGGSAVGMGDHVCQRHACAFGKVPELACQPARALSHAYPSYKQQTITPM